MLKDVYKIAVGSRLVTICLAILTYFFTGSYDSSAEIQLDSPNKHVLNVFLRWDALYFLHIAEKGYIYEQETAFFPVMPLLSRLLANTLFSPLQQVLGKQYALLLSGVFIANVSFILAAGVLYKLTLALLPRNQKIAMVSSIAFCLSPPAMFMSSFYTESLFALLSFTGMLWVIQKKYLMAAIIWGIGSGIRSNAIIYAGFFFYDLVWEQKNFFTGLLRSIVYTIISTTGFGVFQYYGYTQFCTLGRPWCDKTLPLIYSFVQKEYWNNGFLAYYEIKQIPNFLLAAPIILLSIFGLKTYIQRDSLRFWTVGLLGSKKSNPIEQEASYYSQNLAVFMYLWLFLLLFVITNMHIQVIIRFFTSLPPLYWFVGKLWIEGFNNGKNTLWANVVLGYFVLYGLVGIVLYSSFLPPA